MARRIATNTSVDRDALLEFIRPRHRMVLITRRHDGSPQSSPVTGGVDHQGRIVIATYPRRAKTANARRDPQVSVLVISDDWNGAWVQVDGQAEVLDAVTSTGITDQVSLDAFVDYFRCISGEHPNWSEYRQAMVDQAKSLIRITPTRWSTVSTGGFPAELAEQ